MKTEANHDQEQVAAWVRKTFGDPLMNDRERALRFIEEAIELTQAAGVPKRQVEALVEHVYARPPGTVSSEAGGVMITLEVLAEHFGFDLQLQANAEWLRINNLPEEHFIDATKRNLEAGVISVVWATRDD